MKTIWTDEYLASSYEVDAQGKLSLPSLAKFMQETAYNHANHLDFGYEHLKKLNHFWVLSRLQIKMDRYPKWTEKILLRTWPSVIDNLLAYREFQILDESGQLMGVAGSAWLMLDWEKRRPQRTTLLQEKLLQFPKERVTEEPPAKLPNLTHSQDSPSFPVRYSDLDLYEHVNNARYMQWIVDSYAAEIHKTFEIGSFEINFLSESRLGDDIFIQTEELAESETKVSRLHCVRRVGDDRAVCLARLGWKKRK